TFLDKELQKIVRDAQLGRRYVDKLVKVWLKNGDEQWVLIHLEVQGDPEPNFEGRIYEYHSRLFLSYNCPIATFVILGDERPTWKPQEYRNEIWGCKISFQFPIVKLLDYNERWEELENSTNPFATVVMAHLKAKQTRKNVSQRRQWKLFITKRLYEKGYQRQDIINLFHFIDWVMRLPEDLEESFLEDIDEYEEDQRMPYINSAERRGIRKGLEQGRQEGREEGRQEGLQKGLQKGLLVGAIELGLELKFGPEGLELLPEIYPIRDLEVLSAIKEGIKKAQNIAELRSYYQ
ncbi:MAG: Yae1 family protein, partial [Prochloron sp. SP5CPC1]|nr:Yae1 family protein [Candidatus Paraprochloron terpiosi SP5CPC1]